MSLILKTLEKSNRSLYIYYPSGSPRSAFKRCSITVLREESDEASVSRLLHDAGLAQLAEDKQLVLSFPNPSEKGWNFTLDTAGPDDLDILIDMQGSLEVDRALEPAQRRIGIPSFEAMISSWHPMHDSRYLIGVGQGASMALTLAACQPDAIAAVLTIGGSLTAQVIAQASYEPVPAFLVNGRESALAYFDRANDVADGDEAERTCPYNPAQKVIRRPGPATLTRELAVQAWDILFSKVRRPNTGKRGDVEPRFDLASSGFEIFLEDTRLGDQDGLPHTWFTHVPAGVKAHPEKKVPLMVFFHGGSDNPHEAAEMSKFHELGEREGFITVYPWGSNRASWNNNMDDSGCDDMAFSVALIEYMIANYPVDAQRVYLSGFSNGAAQAQVVALVHPELIAAICHIDSNWPGERLGPSEVDYAKIKPFALAMQKKQTYDYRIPVWYTYGSREPSYPVYKGCSQQNQYDFWKAYNNITVKPTPPRDNPDPCGCGVPGDVSEILKPSARHPRHEYHVQRFFTNDAEPKNYYNYVMLHDKGHDIAEMDATLGWLYVRQYKRNPDGSVGLV